MKKFMVLVMGLVSLGVMAGCDDDSKSVKVPAAVQAAFGEMFPAASHTEVDIIFAGKALEVCFGTGDAWLWTKTGVRLSEVPDVVRRTLQSSQYGTWGIDDVDLYESPDRVWYAIEVEDPQSEREATVRILEDGTLL